MSSENSRTDNLIQFVETKGTQVAGKFKDKPERIMETVQDLELACEGAFSLSQRTAPIDRKRWGAALARACSVFLRKMVIGDWDNSATRLLDDRVVQTFGIGFDKLRPVPAERRTLEVGLSISRGMMVAHKLDETTGQPEARVLLPIAPHTLSVGIEWPLPGTASWTSVPSRERLWTISPEELFELEGKNKLGCNMWLAQQLVMFDQCGITLKDVIRMVATFEGAHSMNVSRLLQSREQKTKGPFQHPERHILDSVTIFGMKYTHIVVIECALYLYEMLANCGHIERRDDEQRKLRLSFWTPDEGRVFSKEQDWLGFAGGLILAFGTAERSIKHRIRAIRPK